ncbi:MAG TPA: carbohydrate ABC transporter permease [Candidatus Onthenecus intestinigallinarum]|uniref:Carbohydrate ABC transporter permease n=1 Tax=Candidatus Onthenecus intestinigallinarum TaxID=2840875 RepID=A0A9D1CRB4_9FIRM|nr:carbohydrate ABC transporter permease [Candidatus Onthenecus intestinigallinarum]
MIEKRDLPQRSLTALNYAIITLVALLCLYPCIHVLAASFSDPVQLIRHRGALLWPTGYSLRGYQTVFNNPNILIGYGNTLFYVLVGTAINIVLTSLGAYALARTGWPMRKLFVFLFVFTMYFNVGIIPTFMLVKGLGMLNTRWAIVLPVAINTWNLIVMRTSFAAVPDELQESAYLDGASDLRILCQIYVPVCKATMAVMLLFYAVEHWNSWFTAMIYLTDTGLYPLQMFVRDILLFDGAAGTTEDANAIYLKELTKYAVIVVSIVPILVVYPFVQKFFVKGVMLGSVKG